MSQLPIFELAVGLSFTYFLLSLLCTIINELIAQVFSLRSANLKTGIQQILADSDCTGFAREVLGHPLISASAGKKGPSYISPENFSLVLIDLLDTHSKGAARLAAGREEFCNMIDQLDSTVLSAELKESLKSLVGQGHEKIEDFQKNLQGWFDSSMDRVSGWYKRKTQLISLVVALMLTLILNVDTVHLAGQLWINPALRNQISQEAVLFAVPDNEGKRMREIAALRERLESIPIGWKSQNFQEIVREVTPARLVGWLITALAISLGAPFWFDVINRFASIRAAGVKPVTPSQQRKNEL